MPVETFEDFSTGNDKLTRNFVGARGLEMMETTVSGATTQAYPLYDTHGNMVATLSKNSAGTSWNLANERDYDVWGSVRSGVVTGGPKGRYVANLGHVQDDESGLIYMRARYYEPESGRFVSEDPAAEGKNWYTYCMQNPTNLNDPSGRSAAATTAGIYLIVVQFFWNLIKVGTPDMPNWAKAAGNTIINGLSAAAAYVALIDGLNHLSGLSHPLHGAIGAPLAAIALVGVASILGLAALMNLFWLVHILMIDDVDISTAFGVDPMWEEFR